MSFVFNGPRRAGDQSAIPAIGSRAWFSWHAGWPFAVVAMLLAWLVFAQGDLFLADHLYAWEGQRWALKDGFITQNLIHVLGKRVSAAGWYVVLIAWLASFATPRGRAWRMPLLYLLVATAAPSATVGVLKQWTNFDCPWDMQRYGGAHALLDAFASRPASWARGTCFPAGHASAGYAWVALYFFGLSFNSKWRWAGLGVGLVLGLVFGVAQQLRGAHFLSHDLVTLSICWSIALALHLVFFPATRRAREHGPAHLAAPEVVR